VPTYGRRVRVGIAGCGSVSSRYVETLQHFQGVKLVACADEVPSRAALLAEHAGIRCANTLGGLLSDSSVDLIVNLTPADRHAEVSRLVLDSGHALYSEKPLASDLTSARQLLATATASGLLVGCAPDTIYGRAHQTCRRLIMEGAIGAPLIAFGAMCSHGHEAWHPRPEIFYKRGAGPLLDMGPYYVTSLVDLLGPARHVTGGVVSLARSRTLWSGALRGERVEVQVPTAACAIIQFDSAQATVLTSFESWATRIPHLEIHGTAGVLACPDPSHYRGSVSLWTASSGCWTDIPLDKGFSGWQGLGVADLAWCIANVGEPLVSAARAMHVLEILCAVETSAALGHRIAIESGFTPPTRLLDLRALGWDGHVPEAEY
jgi:predicted dehydrogenase